MKKRGFTLAEVLISLGIIGVVSAITMPALTANYQKKTFEASAKKAYNTISVAIETYMAQEGIDDLDDSDLVANADKEETWTNFANDYFKVAQICSIATGSETIRLYPSENATNKSKCFAETYKSLDRSQNAKVQDLINTIKKGVNFSLTDGSSFTIFLNNSNNFYIIFDTNGINGPNIMGRDLFQANIRADGLVYDAKWKNNYANNPDNWYNDYKGYSKAKLGTFPPGIGKLMADGWQMLY